MKEEDFCPYCDELVEINFTPDYWEYKEGEEFDECKCLNCDKVISISFVRDVKFIFSKKLNEE
jgi:hypothetical protein